MSASLESEDDQFSQKVTIDALEELDFDLIEDMPWAQQLWRDVGEHTKRGFLHWCKIVRNVAGTQNEHVREWSKLYCQSVDEILCDMVLDVLRVQNSTIDKIEQLLKKLQRVCSELHEPIPRKIGEKKLSLYEEQEQLMKHIQEYEIVINAKKEELETLQERQRKLCMHLGVEPKFTLEYPPLPTPAQLEEFQKHIDHLESEKVEREEKYFFLKNELMLCVDEIKYKPNSDFERKVLSSDTFLVTRENMEKLEFFCKCLIEIKKSTEEEISHLRNRIEDLWKMLDVDLMDRDEFRTHYTGNSLDTLEALRVEVKRCEEIRKANIKIFVEKLRSDLESMWKKCHCSETDKKSFKFFYSDCYTEDLLDIHELEINKWKKYYEENNRLLSLLERHQELWDKVIQLEKNATGTNRYKNRGGQLLQEEKERNKLSKLIPKIEEEILALSEAYKQNHDVPFSSFGRTPEEYIEYLHSERENTRKLKLSARKIQRDNTLGHTPAKSAIRLFPSTSTAATPTLLSATKRKVFATPNSENVKRIRLNTPKNPLVKPKNQGTVPKIKISHATMTLPSQKRKSRSSTDKRKRRRSSRKSRSFESSRRRQAPTESEDTQNTTYSAFQNELSSREQCRSTILPEEILRTPAASSPRRKRMKGKTQVLQTPLRTPLAPKTPQSRTPLAPKTPQSRTPNSASKNLTKLSACKSSLKLLF